jgi:hypothetical protein
VEDVGVCLEANARACCYSLSLRTLGARGVASQLRRGHVGKAGIGLKVHCLSHNAPITGTCEGRERVLYIVSDGLGLRRKYIQWRGCKAAALMLPANKGETNAMEIFILSALQSNFVTDDTQRRH